MTSMADLENAIDTLINHPNGPGSYALTSAIAHKAYEAYVFGLCLRAVRELGATVTLVGIGGNANPFIFRGAPGQIHSTYKNYGYATVTLNNHDFEIHCGVEFVGTSGMLHELDVCIMTAEQADLCRRNRVDPRVKSVVGAWECKFYGSTLNKNLARAFVGLVSDLGTKPRLKGFCSNRDNLQIRDYLRSAKRPYPHLELSPLRVESEGNFVGNLKSELTKLAF